MKKGRISIIIVVFIVGMFLVGCATRNGAVVSQRSTSSEQIQTTTTTTERPAAYAQSAPLAVKQSGQSRLVGWPDQCGNGVKIDVGYKQYGCVNAGKGVIGKLSCFKDGTCSPHVVFCNDATVSCKHPAFDYVLGLRIPDNYVAERDWKPLYW